MNRRLRVLYLNHNFESEGTFLRCFFIARELAKNGHALSLLTVSNDAPQLWIKKKRREGVEIITLPSWRRRKDYFFYLVRPFVACVHVLFSRYDVIHAFTTADVLTALPAIVGSVAKRRDIYVDWDDYYSDDGFCRFRPLPCVMVPWTNFLEKTTPRIAKKVTAVSVFLCDKYIQNGIPATHIVHIPNGCDYQGVREKEKGACRQEVGLSREKTVLAYMGRAHHSFPRLYKSFVKINPADAIMLCIGEFYEHDNSLDTSAVAPAPNVIFTGHISYEKIPVYLGASDICLMPMENTSIEKARWPVRFGDYLCAGRPVIANSVGEVGMLTERHRCGVTVEDIEGIIPEALVLAKNKNHMRALGENARKTAETILTWERSAEKMRGVYV